MKFANLYHNGLSRSNDKRIINLGDAFEIIAIDRLYKKMGIEQSEIVDIDLYNLESYSGEKLILPINFMIMPKILGVDMLNMSSDIIPVFLGVTLTQFDLTEKQKDFLKKFQPIGCRDEYTKVNLNRMGIHAYLAGCIVTTIESKCNKKERKKIFFIDVPAAVEKYIPDEMRKDIVFEDHEFMASIEDVSADPSYKKRALNQIDYYDKNAKMIVTSRFHGAVIALALGIPVILTVENNFYKFSWLSKLLNLYEAGSYDKIDWNPQSVNVELLKSYMIEVAINRLKNAYSMYDTVEKLDRMLENSFRSDALALRYANSAIEYISANWEKNCEIEYGLWGINDNAEYIYQFISDNYKNAKLVKIYDGLRTVVFHNYISEYPSEQNIPEKCFLFVASNTAHRVAEELFKKIKKKNYFLCKLEFIQAKKL